MPSRLDLLTVSAEAVAVEMPCYSCRLQVAPGQVHPRRAGSADLDKKDLHIIRLKQKIYVRSGTQSPTIDGTAFITATSGLLSHILMDFFNNI